MDEKMSDLARKIDNRSVYHAVAEAFDQQRSQRLFERPWLDRFLALMGSNPQVLDLGCGTGRPIDDYLIQQGAQLTGVDFAPNMLCLARAYFPQQRWVDGDIRDLDFSELFDGIISWDGFFHLTQAEQRTVLPKLAALLSERGVIMLTIGHAAGEVTGTVDGQRVYHASLSIADYTSILLAHDIQVVDYVLQDPDLYGHSVILGRKSQ